VTTLVVFLPRGGRISGVRHHLDDRLIWLA